MSSETMNGVDALQMVQNVILMRSLTDVEEAIFLGTWSGKRYEEIAQTIGYDSGYIKEIGSRLWSSMSQKIERKVTKKTLRIVIEKWALSEPTHSAYLSFPEHSSHLASTNEIERLPIRFPQGVIAPQSQIYIRRSNAEDRIISELRKPGAFVHLRSPSRFGKTSLLYSIAETLSRADFRIVFVDFSQFEQAFFEDLNRFLKSFLFTVLKQLHHKIVLDEYWLTDAGAKNNATETFERLILADAEQPLLLVLDNLNRIFEFPALRQEFLQMLKAWHERAAIYQIWNNIRLVTARDLNPVNCLDHTQSPFNVGLPIQLPSFTFIETQALAQRYGLLEKGLELEVLKSLHDVVDGHPYLMQLACYELKRQSLSTERLVEQITSADSIYASHLLQSWQLLSSRPELKSGLTQILESSEPVALPLPVAYCLEGIGLVKFTQNKVTMRCELYRRYFLNCLLAEQESHLRLPMSCTNSLEH